MSGDFKTLLHMAALNGHLDVVELALIRMPQEMLTLTDYDDNNVFHHACKNGNTKVIERLAISTWKSSNPEAKLLNAIGRLSIPFLRAYI